MQRLEEAHAGAQTYRWKANTRHARLQETHLATVIEILQSIRQSEMSPILSRIYESEGGTEVLDVLMKYMYVTHQSGRVLSWDVPNYTHSGLQTMERPLVVIPQIPRITV